MRIQLLSDLHLEVQPDFRLTPARGADLLVLAGDVGSYQSGSRLTDPDFGLARFSPLHGWPVPVLYVPGNHEYDGLDFDETHARLRDTCRRLGIIWLERECVVIDGVRFIGTTLWSDFDALALADPRSQNSTAFALELRDKAFRAANYYLSKTGATWQGQPVLAPQIRELGLQCQQWLQVQLAVGFDGPTVAITHFAPSLRSADPRYGLRAGTAGFCNGLDALLPKADLWLHGHLHCAIDYQAEGCRVVANPLGYADKNEQAAFIDRLVLDVPNRNSART